jgi:alkylation response protein AidB-like acyl-CoA dehydrogenase
MSSNSSRLGRFDNLAFRVGQAAQLVNELVDLPIRSVDLALEDGLLLRSSLGPGRLSAASCILGFCRTARQLLQQYAEGFRQFVGGHQARQAVIVFPIPQTPHGHLRFPRQLLLGQGGSLA